MQFWPGDQDKGWGEKGSGVNDFMFLGDQTLGDTRLNGIGWIGAMLVVGATIIAARLLIGWQVRRLERLAAQKDADAGEEVKRVQGKRERADG